MNTQICTNMEQSKRLLKLGLKPKTADMLHYKSSSMKIWCVLATPYTEELKSSEKYYIPAWSLHRLIGLLGEDRLPVSLHRKGEASIKLNQLHPRLRGGCGYSHYDSIIDIIEYLISRNMFNEEYLEG